jgi:hypothetical protein
MGNECSACTSKCSIFDAEVVNRAGEEAEVYRFENNVEPNESAIPQSAPHSERVTKGPPEAIHALRSVFLPLQLRVLLKYLRER